MEDLGQSQASRRSVLRTSALGLGSAIAGASLAGAQSAAAAPAVLPTQVGAAGLYLTLDGIPGEAIAKGHEKTIEVIDASWNVDAATSWTKGGGASVAKPNPGGLSVSIRTSAATPLLLNRIASGTVIKTGRLDVVRSAGASGTPTEVLQLALTELFVTNLATHIGSDALYDDVTFVFRTITFSVFRSTTNGTQGAEVKTVWDIPAGKVS